MSHVGLFGVVSRMVKR